MQFARLDPDRPGVSEPSSVIGKQVVVSAGSPGSTELLLRSRDRHRTLPNLPARLTAHPLGGCTMSDRAEDGVVNDRGEVWGHPGLFVVDGAIIPGALTVNPSMTITALSERVAQWMIHGKELEDRHHALWPGPAAAASLGLAR